MRTSLLKRRRGFTLIELLVVIVIIALLMAIAIPAYLSQQKKAKLSQTKQYLTTSWKSARGELVSNSGSSGYPAAATLSNLLGTDQPQLSFKVGNAASVSQTNQIVISPTSGGKTLLMYALSGTGDVIQLSTDDTSAGSDATHLTNIGVPVSSPYAAAVLADNPSLYLRMNDAGATATDASTGAHNGTNTSITNSVAHAFVTEPANTSYGYAGNVTSLTTVASGSAPNYDETFTVEFWMKVSTSAGLSRWIAGKYAGSTGWKIQIDNTGKLTLNTLTFFPVVADNTWHMIDLVFDNAASGNNVVLYVDGTNVTNGDLGAGVSNPAAPLEVGATVGSGTFTPSSIDELAIYPAKLSAARISAHYAQR